MNATSIILGKFEQEGFALEISDDHTLELKHNGELIAVFSQGGDVEQSILDECATHLGWHAAGEI
jgi:hypothetical protein